MLSLLSDQRNRDASMKDLPDVAVLKKYANPILNKSVTVAAAKLGVFANVDVHDEPLVPVLMRDMVVKIRSLPYVKSDLQDLHLVAGAAVTVCVATSSPERCFSQMHLINTPLRNRLTPEMLDALMRIAMASWSDDDILGAVKLWWNAGDPDRTRRRVDLRFAPDSIVLDSDVKLK